MHFRALQIVICAESVQCFGAKIQNLHMMIIFAADGSIWMCQGIIDELSIQLIVHGSQSEMKILCNL